MNLHKCVLSLLSLQKYDKIFDNFIFHIQLRIHVKDDETRTFSRYSIATVYISCCESSEHFWTVIFSDRTDRGTGDPGYVSPRVP